MSTDATRWAWTAPIKNSSQRLVLLSLADRAGENHTAWPSMERLASDTALNLKTVKKVVNELIEIGLLIDTGERKGHTNQVRVLQLIGVDSREQSQNWDHFNESNIGFIKDGNKPKNGTVKQTQKRVNSLRQTNPILEDNKPKNGICNEPNIGSQNLKENLSMNLSGEHDWIPDQNQLIAVLNSAGQQQNLELIFGLPDFEFQLGAFNTHFDGLVLSDSKKLYKFANWIIDKFERYQKANPNYVKQAIEQSQPQQAQPLINLPSKPKSLLESMQ